MTTEVDYFDWLCKLITDEDFDPSRYQLLLEKLYHTTFVWTLDMDKNRAADGLDLRNQYAKETDQDIYTVKLALNFPCSMLEMMVALAQRCERQIMIDLFVGPRIGRWFSYMLDSLGVMRDVDSLYDEEYVDYVITSFLHREYEPNGDGGLFLIKDSQEDLRELEIWHQMNLYLRELEAG